MRLIHKIVLAIVVSALVFVVSFYLAMFQFGLMENLANRALRDMIGDKLPLQVYIENIEGDLFSQLVLKNANVIYDDGTEKYVLASIPELSLRYSFLDLWRGNLVFKSVFIESAELSLKQGDDGWLFPKPTHTSESKRSPLDFEINNLGLDNLMLTVYRAHDTLMFEDIVIKAHLMGREGTYSVDIDGLRYTSSEKRFNLVTAGGKLTLSNKNLMFQDIFVVTDSSMLALDGRLLFEKEIRGELLLNDCRVTMSEVSKFIDANLRGQLHADGVINLDRGEVAGTVLLSGDFMERRFDSLMSRFRFADNRFDFDTLSGIILNGCAIEARGDLDFSPDPDVYHVSGTIGDFSLNNVVDETYDSRLNGFIDLSGQGLRSDDLVLRVAADLGESWFDEYHAYAIRGDMEITTDSIRFLEGFEVVYGDNLFVVSGRVNYSAGLYLDGYTEFDDLAAFAGQTFIERPGGRGQVNFTVSGKTKNPDIMAFFESDSLWLYDVYSRNAVIDVNVMNFLYDRKGEVVVSLRDGIAYAIPYDSIFMQMEVDSQTVRFEDLAVHNDYAQLRGEGSLDYISYPQRLVFSELNGELFNRRIENDDSIIVAVDSAGYDIIQCRLLPPVGFVNGVGRINYDESLEFAIDMERIKISDWLRLLSDGYEIDGELSGRIMASGFFQNPEMSFRGRIDSLTNKNVLLGHVYANIQYLNKQAFIDSVYLDSRTGGYRARGIFPIDLTLGTVAERFPNAEQNIDITAHDIRFDLLTLYIPAVERLRGNFEASFNLSGQPLTPNIYGQATVRNGVLKPFDLELPLDSLNVDIVMNNKTITIESATARCRNGRMLGRVNAAGQIVINNIDEFDYNVGVNVRNFPVRYELGDISALLDADLSIQGATPPTIYGDVTIYSGMYRENFASDNSGWVELSALDAENSWDFNINAEIMSNLWIKNDDIDAELSGDINFIRETGKYRYLGSMEILRGKGYLADRTFRIESGAAITYNDIEYPNPELDIYATTKVRGVSNEVDQFGQPLTTTYDLRVHITGTLDEPVISAAEGSQFSTEEIVPLIFTNYYAGDAGSGDATERFGDRLASAASGYLSTQFTQIGSRTLGVETFEIDPVYGDKFDPLGTQLTVGFYTHPNLYVYGKSAISGVSGKEVGFEYRLKRFLLMEGRVDENYLYNLLLNFYWDY
ncbi:MAG: translocation/assembly module TamB domain-containing protein [candidate division Zixibacteria bacterium]|nr:translocation/assembly module TamB domain-containing protein [candidate division Zixibacteria bacterium]